MREPSTVKRVTELNYTVSKAERKSALRTLFEPSQKG